MARQRERRCASAQAGQKARRRTVDQTSTRRSTARRRDRCARPTLRPARRARRARLPQYRRVGHRDRRAPGPVRHELAVDTPLLAPRLAGGSQPRADCGPPAPRRGDGRLVLGSGRSLWRSAGCAPARCRCPPVRDRCSASGRRRSGAAPASGPAAPAGGAALASRRGRPRSASPRWPRREAAGRSAT